MTAIANFFILWPLFNTIYSQPLTELSAGIYNCRDSNPVCRVYTIGLGYNFKTSSGRTTAFYTPLPFLSNGDNTSLGFRSSVSVSRNMNEEIDPNGRECFSDDPSQCIVNQAFGISKTQSIRDNDFPDNYGSGWTTLLLPEIVANFYFSSNSKRPIVGSLGLGKGIAFVGTRNTDSDNEYGSDSDRHSPWTISIGASIPFNRNVNNKTFVSIHPSFRLIAFSTRKTTYTSPLTDAQGISRTHLQTNQNALLYMFSIGFRFDNIRLKRGPRTTD